MLSNACNPASVNRFDEEVRAVEISFCISGCFVLLNLQDQGLGFEMF